MTDALDNARPQSPDSMSPRRPDTHDHSRMHRPGRHGVRREPPRVQLLLAAVELAAMIASVAALSTLTIESGFLIRSAVIVGLSAAFAEVTYQVQRMRRRLVGDALINMNSVWVIAAVLCLPIAWTAVTVAANLAFNAARSRQHRGRPYRVFYTGCTVLLSALAASATADAIQPHIWTLPEGGRTVAAAMIACLVAFGVNLSLVVTTIHLATPSLGFRNVFPSRDELALEGATLILGVLTAETLLGLVLLTPAILLVMLLLQRSSLVAQLEVAATTDPKTGLLNARAWQVLAERELLRSQRDLAPSAVLLLDLDFFKRVNDTVGHLGGDAALRDVADAIRRELRGYDAVARFGGEEFVVFLNDVTLEAAHAVAERTIARIRTLSVVGPSGAVELTASVGLSGYPMHGSDLTDLLQAADSALYRAKSAGRDRVEMPLLTVDTNNA